MTFNDYQEKARSTAIYPNLGNNYVYPVLGLCGETGEISEKIKKVLRDNDGVIGVEQKELIKKEMGDVLWYCSNLASELGLSMEEVAQTNIDKLQARKEKGVLRGSGDNR